jgi:hypothetical protein
VGFPFGIGSSVSAGLVSGLWREFHSPEDQPVMTNLMQVAAAANPGNSGIPLVNANRDCYGHSEPKQPGASQSSPSHFFIGNGLSLFRDKGIGGYRRYLALRVLGRNLQTLGNIFLEKERKHRREQMLMMAA